MDLSKEKPLDYLKCPIGTLIEYKEDPVTEKEQQIKLLFNLLIDQYAESLKDQFEGISFGWGTSFFTFLYCRGLEVQEPKYKLIFKRILSVDEEN